MDRRAFLGSVGVGALAASGLAAQEERRGKPFSMKFAPHFGMFGHSAGDDPVAQLEFAHREGFTAWEDNGMSGRPAAEQKRIADAMARLGMTMGIFVMNPNTAWGPTLSRGDTDDRAKFLDEARASVEVAKRVNAKWMTVVAGTREPRLGIGYQTAYAVESLRRACEVLQPHGLVMVLEPLNPRDHPNMLLSEMHHAFEVCRAVDSPSCKILCDLYHQQVTEGNLIDNIDRCWDEIGYFQIGDNPGRCEPTTGETNFRNVFAHIAGKGYTGVLGMEHGNSRPGVVGEEAVIAAYRACDPG